MAIRIVTIEREFGAGAAEIAEALSKKLGWRLLDKELTDEIARVAHVPPDAVRRCDERVDPLLYRLGKSFFRGSYESSASAGNGEAFDADCLVRNVIKVVEQMSATGDCVIVGRGAPYILRQRPEAFHVFLYAPYEEKIRRVRACGKSLEDAQEMVENVDRERIAFVKKYFQKDWPTRYLFHLMINTTIGVDAVIDTILHGMKIAEAQPAAYTSDH